MMDHEDINMRQEGTMKITVYSIQDNGIWMSECSSCGPMGMTPESEIKPFVKKHLTFHGCVNTAVIEGSRP